MFLTYCPTMFLFALRIRIFKTLKYYSRVSSRHISKNLINFSENLKFILTSLQRNDGHEDYFIYTQYNSEYESKILRLMVYYLNTSLVYGPSNLTGIKVFLCSTVIQFIAA
jgi:hypothetical protein